MAEIFITQPDIPVPPKDKLSWAWISRIREQWERSICPQFGLDTSKMILGHVLSTITGDDENVFSWSEYRQTLSQNDQVAAQERLMIRMDWEIATPEIPEKIRKLLTKTKEEIFQSSWSDPNFFQLSLQTWFQMEQDVELIINKSDELGSAIIYHSKHCKTIDPLWNQFLIDHGFIHLQDPTL